MSTRTDWDQKQDVLQAGLEQHLAYYIENNEALNAELFSDLLEVLTKFKAEGFTAEDVVDKTLQYSAGWTKESFKDWEELGLEDRERAYAYQFMDQYVRALTDTLIETEDWSNREIILRQHLIKKSNFYDNHQDRAMANILVMVYVSLLNLMDESSDSTPQEKVKKVYDRIAFSKETSAPDLYCEDEARSSRAQAYIEVGNDLHTLFQQDIVADWDATAVMLKTGLAQQAAVYSGLANITREFNQRFTPVAEAFDALLAELERSEQNGMTGKSLVEYMSAAARARYKEASKGWSFEDSASRSEAMTHNTVDSYVQTLIYGTGE